MLVARNDGSRGPPSWPVGRLQLAGTGLSCWGASAIPSATASHAGRLAAWRPCGSYTCQRAHPSRALCLCWLRLSRVTEVAAYEALCPWVKHTQYLEVSDHLLYSILRTRSHAKLTVRTRHPPPTCGQACVSGDLSRAAAAGRPAGRTSPVQVFSHAERRLGALTLRRRRLTACRVPPVGTVPHV